MLTQPMNWSEQSACKQVFQPERRIHQHLSIKQIDSSCGIEYQKKIFIGIGNVINIDIVILRNKTLGIGLDWKQKSRLVLVLFLK
jgi:hypothetical protein